MLWLPFQMLSKFVNVNLTHVFRVINLPIKCRRISLHFNYSYTTISKLRYYPSSDVDFYRNQVFVYNVGQLFYLPSWPHHEQSSYTHPTLSTATLEIPHLYSKRIVWFRWLNFSWLAIIIWRLVNKRIHFFSIIWVFHFSFFSIIQFKFLLKKQIALKHWNLN